MLLTTGKGYRVEALRLPWLAEEEEWTVSPRDETVTAIGDEGLIADWLRADCYDRDWKPTRITAPDGRVIWEA